MSDPTPKREPLNAPDSLKAFDTTHWSVVLLASGGLTADSRQALETLCRTYWSPLYAYLRRTGITPEESKDLVQGFLARLLERDDLATVGPEKGRFRTYLLAGLRNFLVSERRRSSAQKRGGHAQILSLDSEEAERICGNDLASERTPEAAFDRRWAETILERALAALRAEHEAKGKVRAYDQLKPFLSGDDEGGYARVAAELGMSTGTIAVAVHRLRARLRDLIRHEVARTVGSEGDVDAEMRTLMTVWTGGNR